MPDVVVVGAGPVGLTAALLLAGRGLRVEVLERHAAPYALPRAVHLDDECLRVLQEAGVAEQLLAAGRPMAGLRLVDRGQRTLAEFRRTGAPGASGWPQATMFHQPDLERLLRARVAAQPLVALRAGAEVTGLLQDDDGVRLTVRGGDAPHLHARAVVACDGASSTVRRLVGARLRALGADQRWLVLDVRSPAPLPVWPGVTQVCDPVRPATVMPVTGDRYRWEARLADGETVAGRTDPAALAGLLAPVDPAGVEVVRAAEYVFRAAVADRWRVGRVLLAGDAAHLSPPFIGQGLGLGLRDVHQLAWKLAAVLAGRADDALLDTHGAERAPHAAALVRVAQLAGWAVTGGGAAGSRTRRAVLGALPRVPGLAGLVTAGRTPPLRSGPLVDRRGRPGRRLAGTLVPQPTVTVEGRDRRLDEVLGEGWAELRRSGPGAVVVRRDGAEVHLADAGLDGWLARAGARCAVVRPDRVVAAAR